MISMYSDRRMEKIVRALEYVKYFDSFISVHASPDRKIRIHNNPAGTNHIPVTTPPSAYIRFSS